METDTNNDLANMPKTSSSTSSTSPRPAPPRPTEAEAELILHRAAARTRVAREQRAAEAAAQRPVPELPQPGVTPAPETVTIPHDLKGRAALYKRVASGELERVDDNTYRVRTPAEVAAYLSAEAARQSERQRREAEEARVQRRVAGLARRQRLWETSGVPERYIHADLRELQGVPAAYSATAAELVKTLSDPSIVVLVGGRGPGKTELACGLVREFCRASRSARYLKTLEVFRMIKSTWGRGRGEDNETDVVDPLRRVDLLVLDEIQVRSESDWENAILTDLIDSRYASLRPTVMIANLEPNALVANVGDSIASRIKEGGRGKVIPCLWPSFRDQGTARPPVVPERDPDTGRFEYTAVIEGAAPTLVGHKARLRSVVYA